MRSFLFVFALFCLTLLLTSCEKDVVRKSRKAYKDYFKEILKDPSSLKVYSEKYEMDGERVVKWTLDIGAKNSYGAMVRSTYKIKTIGSSRTIWINDNELYNLDDKK